ncbi:unnamed protein product [Alopecurus aequalis]
MSLTGSSSGGKRLKYKASSSVAPPPVASPAAVAYVLRPAPLGPPLLLVRCPCCQVRRTVRCASRSEDNPACVFCKCTNHGKGANSCNHYYWEDGEDNYVDFLIANGFIVGGGTASVDYSSGDFGIEAIDEEEANGLKKNQSVKKMDQSLKKMDELIALCRTVISALVLVIAIMLYVVVAK